MKTLYFYPFNESIMLGIIKNLLKTEFFYIAYSDMSMSEIKDFSAFEKAFESVLFKEDEIEIKDHDEHWIIPSFSKQKLSGFDYDNNIKEKALEEIQKYKLKFPEEFI